MRRLRHEIGLAGVAAALLIAAALAFSALVVRPLEAQNEALTARPARKAENPASGRKVAAVYNYLRKDEDTTDWLAKLHAIGVATGVRLKSASYKTQKTEGRIVRTEVVLPVAGSYSQIRDFLKRSLAEIPVLSVDSLSLKRAEGTLQAEMRLTLHMVKS